MNHQTFNYRKIFLFIGVIICILIVLGLFLSFFSTETKNTGGVVSQQPEEIPTNEDPSIGVFCTADVRICPDGSYVSRQAPSCAFAACPIGSDETTATPPPPISSGPVFCTMDAKLCPDGSYVGRTGPSCEFTPCP